MAQRKFDKLIQPAMGQFGRNEWAILGTVCAKIRLLASALATQLAPGLHVAYADADHHGEIEAESKAFFLEFTDKIRFSRFDYGGPQSDWQRRAHFCDADLVLINGNHFGGSRQIVALDRRKFDSLQRKTGQLSQVDLFLTDSRDAHFAQPAELPDALKAQLPGWAATPVLDCSDIAGIAAFLEARCPPPPLAALILAGGKSTRMGTDKAMLDYHGMPQWQYLAGLLQALHLQDIRISCRAGQEPAFGAFPVVTDTFLELGPTGAILSAFRQEPDTAWLVLACDLPLMDAATLRYLLAQRRRSALATAFRQAYAPAAWAHGTTGAHAGAPEPLIAIWEPRSYPLLLQLLAQGVSMPRALLTHAQAHLLDAPDPLALLNVNTPEEYKAVCRMLAQ